MKSLLSILLATLFLGTLPGSLLAADEKLTVIFNGSHKTAKSIAQTFIAELTEKNKDVEIDQVDLQKGEPDPDALIGLRVPIGIAATETAIKHSVSEPILSLYIPWTLYDSLHGRYPNLTAIYRDQSIEKQLELLFTLFPKASTVLTPTTAAGTKIIQSVSRAGERTGRDLRPLKTTKSSLIDDLDNNKDVDAIVSVYDPELVTRITIKQLIYFSFRNRILLISNSKAMVNYGAAAAIFSDPKEVGTTGAELARKILQGTELPYPAFTTNYQVACNTRILKYLGIDPERCSL